MSYVLFLLRTRAWETEAWDTASQTALRNCAREVREEPIYIHIHTYIYGFLLQRKIPTVKHGNIANHDKTDVSS